LPYYFFFPKRINFNPSFAGFSELSYEKLQSLENQADWEISAWYRYGEIDNSKEEADFEAISGVIVGAMAISGNGCNPSLPILSINKNASPSTVFESEAFD
tara:strand:- start:6 stop:308 length:303 start_codon:yes stop_codon:yes gene_type:complete